LGSLFQNNDIAKFHSVVTVLNIVHIHNKKRTDKKRGYRCKVLSSKELSFITDCLLDVVLVSEKCSFQFASFTPF